MSDDGNRSLFPESPVVGLDSYKRDLKKNDDGTVDVYFASNAPPARGSNTVFTREGKPFFVVFRIYGPQKGAVDGSWILKDIEKVKLG
jgi:hypothetical protein